MNNELAPPYRATQRTALKVVAHVNETYDRPRGRDKVSVVPCGMPFAFCQDYRLPCGSYSWTIIKRRLRTSIKNQFDIEITFNCDGTHQRRYIVPGGSPIIVNNTPLALMMLAAEHYQTPRPWEVYTALEPYRVALNDTSWRTK
jgi:hypothetical protein